MAPRIPVRSVLFSWVVSYVLILLVPLSISLVVYLSTLEAYRTEIDGANSAALQQLRQSLDSYVQEVEKLSLQIEVNGALAEILYVSDLKDVTKSYASLARVLELNQNLRDYSIINNFVKRIMIVFRQADLVWIDYTLYDRQGLLRQLFPTQSIRLADWDRLFRAIQPRHFATLPFAETGGKPHDGLALITSIPPLDPDPAANIVIFIDQAKLLQAAILARRGESATVAILDPDGRIMVSTDPDFQLPAGLKPRLALDSGQFESRVGRQALVISHIKSLSTGWTYVLAMPESIYGQKLGYLRNLIIASVLLCILIGMMVIVVLAKRNYLPLQQVIRQLDPKRTGSRQTNEYQLIGQSLSRLHQQDEAIQAHFVYNLLKGRVGDLETVNRQAGDLGLAFEEGGFVVVLVYFESDNSTSVLEIDWDSLHRDLGTLFQAAFSTDIRVWQTEYAEMSAFLANLAPGIGAEWKGLFQEALGNVQERLAGSRLINSSIAVSDRHDRLSDIPCAFHEALDTMEYRLIEGRQMSLFYGDTHHNSDRDRYLYSFDAESRLSNLIISADATAAWALVEELVFRHSPQEIDVKLARCLMYDIVVTILKTLTMENIADFAGEITASGQRIIERLNDPSNMGELKHDLQEYVSLVCLCIGQNRKVRTTGRLVQQVRQVITANHADPNFSLTLLADQLDMNPKYLASLYKAQGGESISDCLQKTRIAQAKILLREKRLSIAEVATLTGYVNSNALIRAFKNYEGLTPGLFKELINSEQ